MPNYNAAARASDRPTAGLRAAFFPNESVALCESLSPQTVLRVAVAK